MGNEESLWHNFLGVGRHIIFLVHLIDWFLDIAHKLLPWNGLITAIMLHGLSKFSGHCSSSSSLDVDTTTYYAWLSLWLFSDIFDIMVIIWLFLYWRKLHLITNSLVKININKQLLLLHLHLILLHRKRKFSLNFFLPHLSLASARETSWWWAALSSCPTFLPTSSRSSYFGNSCRQNQHHLHYQSFCI
jgi:hypothetical protein